MKHWIIKFIILVVLVVLGVIVNEMWDFNDYLLGFIVGSLIQAILQMYDVFTVKSQSDQN